MSDKLQSTPTLDQVISLGIDAHLLDLNTCLPGIIQSYDPATQTCSVQPAIKRQYDLDDPTTLVARPVISKVPVVWPSSSQWSFTGPLASGDACMIVFSQRSLDVWKKSGGLVDPQDPRKFNLTDAVVWPGGRSPASPISGLNSNVQVKFGSALFELQSGGKFKLKGASDELLDLLSQTLAQLVAAETSVGPLLNADQFTALKTKLDALKGS